jgi:hypothetical protein
MTTSAERSNMFVAEMYSWLEGCTCMVDGIEVMVTVNADRRIVTGRPTAEGKKSEAYREAKAFMDADFVIDMTEWDGLCDMALAMGFRGTVPA